MSRRQPYEMTNAAWAAAAAEDAKVVPQANGPRYAGPIIDERFQVMESYIGATLYVVDHMDKDLLVRAGRGGEILRFNSIEQANLFIKEFTGSKKAFTQASSRSMPSGAETQETNMAGVRTNKKVAEQATEKKNGVVPAKAAKALDSMRAAVAKAAAPTAQAAPPKAGRKLTEGKTTVASFIRGLITEGKLSDEKILEKARSEFPTHKVANNAVKWYREKMQASA